MEGIEMGRKISMIALSSIAMCHCFNIEKSYATAKSVAAQLGLEISSNETLTAILRRGPQSVYDAKIANANGVPPCVFAAEREVNPCLNVNDLLTDYQARVTANPGATPTQIAEAIRARCPVAFPLAPTSVSLPVPVDVAAPTPPPAPVTPQAELVELAAAKAQNVDLTRRLEEVTRQADPVELTTAKAQNADLTRQLEEMTRQADPEALVAAKAQNEDLTRRLEEMTRQADSEIELAVAKAQNEDLTRRLEEMTRQADPEALAAAKAQNVDLTRRLEEVTRQADPEALAAAKAQNEDLLWQLAEMKRQFAEVQANALRRPSPALAPSPARVIPQSEIAKLKAENERLKAETENAKQEMKRIMSDFNAMRAQFEKHNAINAPSMDNPENAVDPDLKEKFTAKLEEFKQAFAQGTVTNTLADQKYFQRLINDANNLGGYEGFQAITKAILELTHETGSDMEQYKTKINVLEKPTVELGLINAKEIKADTAFGRKLARTLGRSRDLSLNTNNNKAEKSSAEDRAKQEELKKEQLRKEVENNKVALEKLKEELNKIKAKSEAIANLNFILNRDRKFKEMQKKEENFRISKIYTKGKASYDKIKLNVTMDFDYFKQSPLSLILLLDQVNLNDHVKQKNINQLSKLIPKTPHDVFAAIFYYLHSQNIRISDTGEGHGYLSTLMEIIMGTLEDNAISPQGLTEPEWQTFLQDETQLSALRELVPATKHKEFIARTLALLPDKAPSPKARSSRSYSSPVPVAPKEPKAAAKPANTTPVLNAADTTPPNVPPPPPLSPKLLR
jgi:hypothetical protein